LRFTPSQVGAPAAVKASGGIVSSLIPRMPRGGARKTASGGGASRQVWVLQGDAAVAVGVTPGISDGRLTEITAGELQAGMLVITDQRSAGAAP
ncbi:MAG: efflux RND transporter periplasmic adaptor subunit, partial [Rhodoferax sp.]|nr:efflux RND transporter periplasmic adaptor subunit [Rhodoferax sp.]